MAQTVSYGLGTSFIQIYINFANKLLYENTKALLNEIQFSYQIQNISSRRL